MEQTHQIHYETKQCLFWICKEIEANENKLKVLQTEGTKLQQQEANSGNSRQPENAAEQCKNFLEMEVKACKRQLHKVEEEREELLRKKSRFDKQESLMDEAEKVMRSMSQYYKGHDDTAKAKIDELEAENAELLRQLRVASTERDELKFLNVQMSHQLKMHRIQLNAAKSETDEIKQSNVKLEELRRKEAERVTFLSEQLEASERILKISEAQKNLLNDNISLLKRQVSLMQDTTELKSKTTINNLPLELLDMILEKSYMVSIRDRNARDEAIIKKLASVEFCWFKRTTRPRFKRAIFRHIKVSYAEISVRSSICRSYRPYLEQVLRSNNLILFQSVECPSNVQARQCELPSFHIENDIESNSSFKLKNTNDEPQNMESKAETRFEDRRLQLQYSKSLFGFFHSIRYFDEATYSSMITCFRRLRLMNTARLAENGGVAVKIKVLEAWKPECSGSYYTWLVKRLISFQDKTRYPPYGIQYLISKLKSIGIEILGCFQQRVHADIWIWCKSQKGLTHLQELYESDTLTDVLADLADMRPYELQGIILHIDNCQFRKKLVSRSVVVKFEHELDFHRRQTDHIVGVAKLENNILVICRSPETVIHLFKDQHPFCLWKTIKQTEILWPEDIVSSVEHECVYVSDRDSKCIWKITSTADDDLEVTYWSYIYSPCAMSVSVDGDLVMIRNHFISVVEVYRSDGRLLRSMEFSSEAQNPRQARRTARGNFVILHADNKFGMEWNDLESVLEIYVSDPKLHNSIELSNDSHSLRHTIESSTGNLIILHDHTSDKFVMKWNDTKSIMKIDASDPKLLHSIESLNDTHIFRNAIETSGGNFALFYNYTSDRVIVAWNELVPVLDMYGSDADLHHSIKLPSDIQNPRQAIETSSGNFVILHDHISENKVELCISEVTRREQKVLHRFIPNNKDQRLGVPYQLSRDSDDRVLVADHWNNRLIILNFDLKWNQSCPLICRNNEIQRPRRMHHDVIKNQLVIAGNGGVNVYNFGWKYSKFLSSY